MTAILDFIYDESGRPFALNYSTNGGRSFTTYYYILNLQGDVVKLVRYIPGFEYEAVAEYTYDAWGNILTATGDMAEINPLRYRGYYYDSETGFYYLQSRYYDPTNRRFINADVYASTGQGFVGTNMFAYCLNNPANCSDSSGQYSNLSVQFGANASLGGAGAFVPRPDIDEEEKLKRQARWIFNDNEQAVLAAEHFAFYKGQFVIKMDWGFTNGRSGSFFVMFLHEDEKRVETVQHEWGHFVQYHLMGGSATYIPTVAIESIFSSGSSYEYYSYPWERTADFFGGVERESGYKDNSLAWGISQFFLGPAASALYLIFGD